MEKVAVRETYDTVASMVSPGLMVLASWIRLCGHISHHRLYWATPLMQWAEEPPCSTMLFHQPSIPTQETTHASPEAGQLTRGATQRACTAWKSVVPAAFVVKYPAQFCEV